MNEQKLPHRLRAIVLMLCTAGCGRYDSYANGYFHLWQDFEHVNTVAADRDKDGLTLSYEMRWYKDDWIKKQGYTRSIMSDGLYDTATGKPLTATEVAERHPEAFSF